MSTVNQFQAISLDAAADYSTTGIYRFMNVDSNGRAVKVSSAGGHAIGILMNDPEQYQAGTIAYAGVAKVYVGTGGVTAGNVVQSDANGAAIAASDEDYCIGIALETAAAGALASVLLVSKNIRNDAA
jgi:hypothetical protein